MEDSRAEGICKQEDKSGDVMVNNQRKILKKYFHIMMGEITNLKEEIMENGKGLKKT